MNLILVIGALVIYLVLVENKSMQGISLYTRTTRNEFTTKVCIDNKKKQ